MGSPSSSIKTAECPCSLLGANESKIVANLMKVLQNQSEFDRILGWIAGGSDNNACCVAGQTCGESRVLLSYIVVKEVRQACLPFFEANDESTPRTDDQEEFPSLMSSPPPKSKQEGSTSQKKGKRRIRPSLLSVDSPLNGGNPCDVKTKGNLVDLPTESEAFPMLDRSTVVSAIPAVHTWQPKKVPPAAGGTSTMIPSVWSQLPQVPSQRQEKHPNSDMCLRNLALLYASLMENSLVPSTVNEIQFLLQCLTVSGVNAVKNTTTEAFATIVSSSEQYCQLAVVVLRKQSQFLGQLGALVPGLAKSPLLRRHEIAIEPIDRQNPGEIEFPSEKSAQFALPFNARRDSRHNFKSAKGQALYKNREESRDAFFYQLRSFLAMRGKLLDSNQQNRALQGIRQSAGQIVTNLMDSNIAWFADFFCELLLQIGTLPIQETDSDLLKMDDQAKLQKLHQRFSAKPVRSKKGSKTLLPRDQYNESSSPFAAAQQYFVGHQEFFFLFLISANHYTFSINLRTLLSSKLKRQDIRMQDKCMLARFLGVMLFSPNWSDSAEEVPVGFAVDALKELEAIGSSVLEAVRGKEIWTTIPFLVELLAMSRWDIHRLKSATFRSLVSYLRRCQAEMKEMKGDHVVSILLCLEYLFGECIGLAETSRILASDSVSVSVHQPPSTPAIRIEALPASPKNQLSELMTFLSETEAIKSTHEIQRASRKLRPSVVEPTDTVVAKSTLGSAHELGSFGSDGDIFLSKLQDGFFHQHTGLKEMCQFVARTSLEAGGARLRAELFSSPGDTNEGEMSKLQSDLLQSGMSFLDSHLQDHISRALKVLGEFKFSNSVIEEAIILTVTYSSRLGRKIVEDLVVAEVEKAKQIAKKRLRTEHKPPKEHSKTLIPVITMITRLNESLSETIVDGSRVQDVCSELCQALENHKQPAGPSPSGTALRHFFESTTDFGEHLEERLLRIAGQASLDGDMKLVVMKQCFRVAILLSDMSTFVLGKTRQALQNKALQAKLIEMDCENSLSALVNEFREAGFS